MPLINNKIYAAMLTWCKLPVPHKVHTIKASLKNVRFTDVCCTWEFQASLSNLCLVSMRHFEDGIMDASKLGYSIYFLWRGVDVPVLQIVKDGVVEEDCILKTKEKNQMFASVVY